MAERDDEADEQRQLRSVALQNADAILAARQRAEQELLAAREALREREERLSAIFNQAAVGMAVAEMDGRFEEVNQKFLDILGYSPAELRQLTFIDITHPENLQQTRENVQRLVDGEVSEFAYEKRFRRKDGTYVWALTAVTLLRDAAGHPRRFVGVLEDISERTGAREALQARERELSLIYSNVSDVIFYVATEAEGRYRFVSVNAAFLTTTGLTEDRVVGKLVSEVIPEPSRSLVLDNYARAIQERQTVRWEETSEYPSGRKVGLVSVTPVFDAAGKCVNLIGTVHDITDRKREEEARARLAAIVESSDDIIVSKTLDGIITTWNEGAERTLGYTAEEVIGKSITIIIPPDRLHEEPRVLERLRRGERIEHYETVRRRKDGTLLDVSLTVSPIRDGEGRIIGASKIARDVTARKRTEAALVDEQRLLEVLNQTGPLIASQLDLRSLAQSVTDAATKLSGAKLGTFFYSAADSEGEPFALYAISGASREEFDKPPLPGRRPLFDEGVARSEDITKDPRYAAAAEIARPSMRSYLAVPVVSRSGEVIGGLAFWHPDASVFTERTERLITGVAAQAAIAIDNARLYEDVRRAAEEREHLLEAERAARAEAERVSLLKDEFLATLSHELRTPLNAILGWSQILASGHQGKEELAEGLEVIERNARVQTQLIEDLLDMSRIISGKIRLDVQRVDVQDVVRAAVASVRHSAEAKEIRLSVVLDPLAGPVRGDPNRLQQCFWNLLSNAIKFTPKGGRVQVGLSRVDSHVEVCVVDSGQGIKPEFLPHVFERFRQADASTTRRHGGLGLGLSIVKHLVELHGGSVRAESAGEGKGATFCIDLPVMVVHGTPAVEVPRSVSAEAAPAAVGAPADRLDYPALDGITVLAVDDEPDARDLLRRVLEQCGAKVVLAGSAREGLEAVRRERPDMIISDIGMPGVDGYSFIREVRRLKPEEGGRTPAAALTAFARAEDRTRALRAGYQTHVAKPVEPTELTAVVASLAERRA